MSPTFPKHINVAFASMNISKFIVGKIGNTPIYTVPYKLLLFFQTYFGFTYKIVTPEDGVFGQCLGDGNWTGVLGLIQRGEADMSFYGLEINEADDTVDVTYPVFYDKFTFVTQKPTPISKSLLIFEPFSTTVWIYLLFAILVFFSLFVAMGGVRRRYTRTLFSTLGNILGQPFTVPLPSKPHVLLFIGWLFAVAFLIHCYKATFFSFLMAVPTKGITTIDELSSAITDDSVQCITRKGNNVIDMLMHSDVKTYRNIGNFVNKSSTEISIPSSYFDPNSIKRTAMLDYESSFSLLKNKMFVSKDYFFNTQLGFPRRKKFRGKKILDRKLRRMFETGLLDKMEKDFEFQRMLKNKAFDVKEEEEKKILTLEDLNSPLLILLVGNGFACVIFIGEILIHKVSRRLELRRKRRIKIRKNCMKKKIKIRKSCKKEITTV